MKENNIELAVSSPKLTFNGNTTLIIRSASPEYGNYCTQLIQLLQGLTDTVTAQAIADIVADWIAAEIKTAFIDVYNFAFDMIRERKEVVLI